MNGRLIWTFVLITLFLSACSVAQSPDVPGTSGPPEESPRVAPGKILVDAPLDVESACPGWRFIGIKNDPGAACPRPAEGDWTVRSLFTSAERGSRRLARYCLYERERSGKDDAILDLVEPRDPARLERVDRDCAALSTSSDDLPAMVHPDLRKQFIRQAGRSEAADELLAPVMMEAAQAPYIRLAFLDTQPARVVSKRLPPPTCGEGDLGPRGLSEHGHSLAALAHELVCDGGTDAMGEGVCAARITTQLALPLVAFDRDSAAGTIRNDHQGGYFGTLCDLAVAIDRELQCWEKSGERRLVLNLSLAFDGKLFGGLDEDPALWPAPVQAIHDMLGLAACRGALVITAAGNRTAGPGADVGPLLPAAWETRPAPSYAECKELLGGEPDRSLFLQGGRALVYAAGGVQADGAPLATTRQSGTPLRVAYADHVAVFGEAAMEKMKGVSIPILTGTSVGSAVISTVAAAVWGQRPKLPPHDLMGRLYASGEDLKRPADFYYGRIWDAAPCDCDDRRPTVHRISLCRALRHTVCVGQGRLCDAPRCEPWSPKPPALDLTAWKAAGAKSAAPMTQDLGVFPPCEAQHIFYTGTPPLAPCPGEQFHDVQDHPWTAPQPDSPPCKACTMQPGGGGGSGLVAGSLGGDYELHVKIDDTWPGGSLDNAFLAIGDVSFALDLPPMSAGDSVVIGDIDPKYLTTTDGLAPPILLRFTAASGTVEIPVFLAR